MRCCGLGGGRGLPSWKLRRLPGGGISWSESRRRRGIGLGWVKVEGRTVAAVQELRPGSQGRCALSPILADKT